jgi:anti-sigma-K factor RskA
MSAPQSADADDRSAPPEDAAHDKSVLAAEYALGTLDADDRANVQMLMAIDPAFAAAVADWERRLGELHALVGPVEAPAATWDWIKARIAVEPRPARLWLPSNEEIAAPSPQPEGAPDGDAESAAAPVPPDTVPQAVAERLTAPPLIALWRARARGWRRATFGIAALAALLLALAAARELRPDLLPEPLRPAPRIVEKPVEVVRTVEVVREVPSPQIAEYVAMLRADPQPAAFALTLDLARRALSVRRLGAERPPEGKDFELWLVSDKYPAPRSLGIVGAQEYTVRRDFAGYDAPTLRAATFGISLEPAGGSPTGAPAGAMLFTGKLTQTTPAAFPAATP